MRYFHNLISETWLDPSKTETDIQISVYILFRQDRGTHKSGGGVVFFFFFLSFKFINLLLLFMFSVV